jgi:hypothetical protein
VNIPLNGRRFEEFVMVVYYLDSETPVTAMPRPQQFNLLVQRLTPSQFQAASDYINALIGDHDIETSSWMPKDPDWTGTPLQPIYEIAARYNYELAAQLFGLLVFNVFMNREDEWITGRFDKDGLPLPGRTYFRKRF